MKIVTASWVHHDGQPIYSIDIQRGDARFTTGGQSSNGSGLVIIWNFAALVSEKCERDETNYPKILSRLDNHTACVNCVRWSESGKFLATAGDDKITMIWQYVGKNSTSLGGLGLGNSAGNSERWKCTHTLRGHTGDILHLAWSAHDYYLASCSIDNTIIVWDVKNFPNKLKTLEGHTGFVKGITWDPVGKYLASQSDDKTLKIWSTYNWSCIKTVRQPFEECGGSTHFLRLDWSADGASLVTSHAMDNGGPVAKIITRKEWTHENEFVGHRKAVTCVRFSSTVYESTKKDGSNGRKKRNYFTVCALGGKDRSISVWSTQYLRPLAVLQNIFVGNVMDLSWSTQCRSKLVACSSDGSAILFDFSTDELGKPLSYADKCSYLQKIHGVSSTLALTNGVAKSCSEVVDDPRLFKLQNESSASSANSASVKMPTEQQQRQKNDGKENNNKKNQEKSPPPVLQKQVESRTQDGRRRIQAVFLGSSVVTEDPVLKNLEITPPPPPLLAPHPPPPTESPRVVCTPQKETPPAAVVSASSSEKARKRKRHAIVSEEEEEEEEEETIRTVAETQVSSMVPETPVNATKSFLCLPQPERQRTLAVSLELVGSSRGIAMITCENNAYDDANVEVCKINCSHNSNVVWQTLLNSTCSALSASNQLVAAATMDKALTVFSTNTGRRLTPRIALDSAVVALVASNWFVSAITSKGSVFVWNFNGSIKLLCKDNLSSIINDKVLNSSITDIGSPVIALSNGKSYAFDFDLNCWIILGDDDDSLAQLSSVKDVGCGGLITSAVSSRLCPSTSSCSINFANNTKKSELQNLATLSHLENLMNSALTIKSKHEYEFWLLQYVRELVRDESNFVKVKNLCQEILDECRHLEMQHSSSKRNLLNQILSIVARNPKLQRIYTEFREQLDAVGESDFI